MNIVRNLIVIIIFLPLIAHTTPTTYSSCQRASDKAYRDFVTNKSLLETEGSGNDREIAITTFHSNGVFSGKLVDAKTKKLIFVKVKGKWKIEHGLLTETITDSDIFLLPKGQLIGYI